MQRTFVFAIILFGLTAAHAQTGGSASIGTDPLSVPTQTLPSAVGGGGGGGAAGGSTPAIGAGGSTSSITAPASTNPQSALQLPGETADTSTDAAKVTTRAAVGGSSGSPSSSSSSTNCTLSVPSTDGGSANLTDILGGGSLTGGC